MASWASIATKDPQLPAEPSEPAISTVQESCAVIDTNALIDGSQLQTYGEQLATIPEVLKEVRDKKTREYLERLPFQLQSMEPSPVSLRAVMAFARDVGELQSLSGVDLKLIALAHTLERTAHGDMHLRSSAPTPKVHAKVHKSAGKLPGWGTEGADWDALDQATGDQPTEEAQESRIKADVQELHNSSAPASENNELEGGQVEEGLGDGAIPGELQGTSNADDGEWEVAASSHNAARRKKRKQARRAARVAAAQQAAQAGQGTGAHHHLEGAADGGDSDDWETDGEHSLEDEASDDHKVAAYAHKGEGLDGGEHLSEEEDEEQEDEDEDADGDENEEEEDVDGKEEASGTDAGAEESRVCIVTADYAMQNVALQMGLRLVAPDGKRIWQTRRWALRCTACFQVCKEAGRLFCSKCGNAALQKVEVLVGSDGAQQYGVRKKHIIRGTRFPLPKPHGGKNSKDPILREDVLLQRIPQLRYQAKKEGTDPFAPEFGIETWHQRHDDLPPHVKAAAASLSMWKVKNPNERKHVRTNRRRK